MYGWCAPQAFASAVRDAQAALLSNSDEIAEPSVVSRYGRTIKAKPPKYIASVAPGTGSSRSNKAANDASATGSKSKLALLGLLASGMPIEAPADLWQHLNLSTLSGTVSMSMFLCTLWLF